MRRPRNSSAMCERLEQRRLLSTFVINGTNNGDVWFLDAAPGQVTVNGNLTNNASITDVQVNGFDNDDAVIVQSASIPVVFNGGNGNDQLILTSSNLSPITAQMTFNAGAGNDFAILHDEGYGSNTTYTFAGSSIDRTGAGHVVFDSSLENAILNTGTGSDATYVQGLSTPLTIQVNGNTGSDFMYVDMNGSTGTVTFDGGPGTAASDSLQVSDYNVIGPVAYTVTSSSISRAGRTINYSNFETALFQGCGATGSTYTVTSTPAGTSFALLGGLASDSFNVRVCNTNTFATGPISIDSFGGSDSLTYNASLWANSALTFWLSGTGMGINTPTEFTTYSGMASLTLQGPAQATTSNCSYLVTSTAASITGQTTITMGTGNNSAFVRPRDQNGNLNMRTPLGIFGGSGADSVTIDDTTGTTAVNCNINNAGGIGTQDFFGFGAAAIGTFSDVESNIIQAGSGNDTFYLDSYKNGSSLSIFGNLGYDVVPIAQSTGDLSANVTSISAFTFNAGPDTFDDGGSIGIDNDASTVSWTYTRTTTFLRAAKTGYTLTLTLANCSYAGVLGGSAVDTFLAQSSPKDTNTDFSGGGGNDQYNIGLSSRTNLIAGTITVEGTFGGTDADIVFIDDSADTVGRIVHVTGNAVCDSIGDTLFSGDPYSAVSLFAIRGLVTVSLGGGADAVYAAPSTTTPFLIKGNTPTITPGDSMNIATSALTNPVWNNFGSGSGELTYVGSPGFHWTGIETVNLDDVRPDVLAVDFFNGPSGAALSVQFSEDVSHSLYLDTAPVNYDPFHRFDPETLAYDAGTNTATWGYPSLPSGSYTLSLRYNDISDYFGNKMTSDPDFKFIWSPGTAGPDQFRVVRDSDTGEYDIFLNGARTPDIVGPPDTAKIVLEGGEDNDSFTVDLAGGNPVPPGGLIFDGGNGSDALSIAGSTDPVSATFEAGHVIVNGSQVDHSDVEAFSFRSSGNFDSVSVIAQKVELLGNPRLDSLTLSDSAAVAMAASGDKLLLTRNLNIDSSGWLNLSDNDMLVDPNAGLRKQKRIAARTTPGASLLSMIEGLIRTARDDGTWNGNGIGSSEAFFNPQHNTTLGALSGDQYHGLWGAGSDFDGEAFSDSAVLVKYTYYGDTDFNGKVDGADYARIDAAFNQQTGQTDIGGWLNGDLDYNGKIDGADYALIDAAFNSEGSVVL